MPLTWSWPRPNLIIIPGLSTDQANSPCCIYTFHTRLRRPHASDNHPLKEGPPTSHQFRFASAVQRTKQSCFQHKSRAQA
ncbi:hypothetical protein SERLA73DRAFT_180245 [Serpula lacrymans var. lacrymans S7.3]|uniref:Uncharacterized protein n=2 Tax=Serpula lacrymans var. lacrymans TaxID=341189 RepID=F8PWB7_SERL3|nr:uncharacterized protein SERLADRAFT_465757 [Serpula lacrymans var. lacrymans S7.9]EGN99922.1 hypothetical protein SERLA73DRAFT_180245 [Serpula lacrymans var. lacrymans S7.3]EGO25491.1 hypothetical protein SERLADRAFT_465757 [Serpula lacrymans var. lacrymans S7.9]